MIIYGSKTALALRIGTSPPKANQRRGAFLSAAIRCFATAMIVSGVAAERPGTTFYNVIGRFA
jgi:DNA-binding transcriptional regulator YdaS (Cro superfamily)